MSSNLSVDLPEDVYFSRLKDIFRQIIEKGSVAIDEDASALAKAETAAELFKNTVVHAHGLLMPEPQADFRAFFKGVVEHDFAKADEAGLPREVAKAFVLRALLDFYFRDEAASRAFLELAITEPRYYDDPDYIETLKNEVSEGLLQNLNFVRLEPEQIGFDVESFDEVVQLQREAYRLQSLFRSLQNLREYLESEYGYLYDEPEDLTRKAYRVLAHVGDQVSEALRHSREYFNKKRRF